MVLRIDNLRGDWSWWISWENLAAFFGLSSQIFLKFFFFPRWTCQSFVFSSKEEEKILMLSFVVSIILSNMLQAWSEFRWRILCLLLLVFGNTESGIWFLWLSFRRDLEGVQGSAFVAVPAFVLSGDRSLASVRRIWQRNFASDCWGEIFGPLSQFAFAQLWHQRGCFLLLLLVSLFFILLGGGNKIVVLALNSSAICDGDDAVWIFRDGCKKFVFLLFFYCAERDAPLLCV